MTPEETTATAQRIVLADLAKLMADIPGIAESLADELAAVPSDAAIAAIRAVRTEVEAIRTTLAAAFAAPAPTDPTGLAALVVEYGDAKAHWAWALEQAPSQADAVAAKAEALLTRIHAGLAAPAPVAEPDDAGRAWARGLIAGYAHAAKDVDDLYRAPEDRQAAADWMAHAEGVIARGIAATTQETPNA